MRRMGETGEGWRGGGERGGGENGRRGESRISKTGDEREHGGLRSCIGRTWQKRGEVTASNDIAEGEATSARLRTSCNVESWSLQGCTHGFKPGSGVVLSCFGKCTLTSVHRKD